MKSRCPTRKWRSRNGALRCPPLCTSPPELSPDCETLNISRGTVGGDVKAILKEWRNERYRDLNAEMLKDVNLVDDLIRRLYTDVQNGNFDSTDRLVKQLERRAKLLGLDAPNQIIEVSSGCPRKRYPMPQSAREKWQSYCGILTRRF